MLNFLYDVFITPLIMGMNFVLVNAYDAFGSYGLAIIVLSLVVNTVLLPLYNMADSWQQEEREKQAKMADKIAEIKQAFSGQERFMMLKTLYRQNNYHPIMAVRNSVGFLIQVPFFFAAYQLLSHFPELNGQSFGPFTDLGIPDGLVSFGDWQINVMPFVMTAINLLSAFVYTQGLSSKDKVQLYVFAGLFLVLLYVSPAGLVLYWTLNNIYSLVKNTYYKYMETLITNDNTTHLLLAKKGFIYLLFTLLLFIFMSTVISSYINDGITQNFLSRFGNPLSSLSYLTYILLFLLLIVFISLLFNKNITYIKERETLSFCDISVVLIVLIPVFQYFVTNKDVIPFYEICIYLLYITCSVIIILVLIPIVISIIVPKIIIQGSLFLILSIIVYMPLISDYFKWIYVGWSFHILLALIILYFLYLLCVFSKETTRKYIATFFTIILFTNTMLSYSNGKNIESLTESEIAVEHEIRYKKIKQLPRLKTKPNIYFLTYDAYVNNETMKQYGLDNSQQEDYLKNNGFSLYDSYTIDIGSLKSMGAVFNLENNELGRKINAAGDALVFDILKSNNYSTAGILYPYFFQNVKSGYDYTFPKFYELESAADSLVHKMVYGRMIQGVQFDSRVDQFNAEKLNFINRKNNDTPFILYSHDALPGHSEDSGRCAVTDVSDFNNRLKEANMIMEEDVEAIMSNDPSALIIINGDHGPRLTKNCDILSKGSYSENDITRADLQDRFGSFLAVKLPRNMKNEKLNIIMLQDIFPEILNVLSDSSSFDEFKIDPITLTHEEVTSGVYIDNGIIHGGYNNGEKLFLGTSNAQ